LAPSCLRATKQTRSFQTKGRVVYVETGSIPGSGFVGEDRHHMKQIGNQPDIRNLENRDVYVLVDVEHRSAVDLRRLGIATHMWLISME